MDCDHARSPFLCFKRDCLRSCLASEEKLLCHLVYYLIMCRTGHVDEPGRASNNQDLAQTRRHLARYTILVIGAKRSETRTAYDRCLVLSP
jgi:hypothetical protein